MMRADIAAQHVRSWLPVIAGLPLIVALFALSGTAFADAGRVSIERASWKAEDAKLIVRGQAKDAGTSRVTVSNEISGVVLGTAKIEDDGRWKLVREGLESAPCSVTARADGEDDSSVVSRAPFDCDNGGAASGPDLGPGPVTGQLKVLAANDLGMHCADIDYQIFSILPPFNVVHGQIVIMGEKDTLPNLLSSPAYDLVYSATSNPGDPVAANSINTTSQNGGGVFKSNFWEPQQGNRTLGALGYESLYPGTDKLGLCDPMLGPCPSALTLFEPLPGDTGIPVPDPAELPNVVTDQQTMPGIDGPYALNTPQLFHRFDTDFPFFPDFPFGSVVQDANWFAADGIPMLPMDDLGNPNAYPLMRIAAVNKGASPDDPANVMASTDLVLPVASEADCQNCHADPSDFGNGAATEFASVNTYKDATTSWQVVAASDAPGPQQLLNASKINILRLHDAKHGDVYTSSADGAVTACLSGTEPSCLANRSPVQCSQCHYSPALDLVQGGPVDEPSQGEFGRQQTRHISMSRAMHSHHGEFGDLFPPMPPPDDPQRVADITGEFTNGILEESCYQCHPGKQTQCLRGAMFNGGVVCQDCHGDMQQVGNDFTGKFPVDPFPDGADLTKRVPWASEPACQSCHIGDAVTVASTDLSDFIVADDGIRLAQAYSRTEAANASLHHIAAPDSRFAEDESLYRLSKGHGGVMCEGCHGSTHAIWPVQPASDNPNAVFLANDNLTSLGLQGHTGTLSECTSCHAPTEKGLPLGLGGPHGMHPVADFDGADQRWNDKHKEWFEKLGAESCQTCHGTDGTGTVLSRVARDRRLECKNGDGSLCGNDQKFVTIAKGTPVGCQNCHENELLNGSDD